MVLFVILLNGIEPFAQEQKVLKKNSNNNNENITLELSVKFNTSLMQLVFVIKNSSNEDFLINPIFSNYNRIILIRPDNKKLEHFAWKNGLKPLIIKASEKRIWKINLFEEIDFYFKNFFTMQGIYKIFWTVGVFDLEYKNIVNYNSNKLFIFRKDNEYIENPMLEKELTEYINEDETTTPVTLNAFLTYGSPNTLISLKIKNNSEEDIETTPFLINNNKITIVKPNKEKVEITEEKKEDETEEVAIKQGESREWNIDIAKLENYKEIFKEKGIYKVYWNLEDFQSNEILFYKEKNEEKENK